MNDHGNIVVDENYSVPQLLMKARVNCNTYSPPPTIPPGYTIREKYIDSYRWRGFVQLFRSDNLADFGSIFEGLTIDSPPDDLVARIRNFNYGLIVVARCASGGYAITANANLGWDRYNKYGTISVSATCELQDALVDVAVYTTTDYIKATPFGMHIYNADGKLLFDLMRPPMMFIGSMRGELNVWQYEAGSFDLPLPDEVEQEHCYITRMSGTPYYSAYNIHSGGVSWGSTGFKSIMSFPTPTTLRVQVVRVSDFQGSNSAFGYGGFFENVVYCPYPYGLYLDPSKL